MFRRNQKYGVPCVLLALLASNAWAQAAPPNAAVGVAVPVFTQANGVSAPTTLKQVFDAAWQRQPEAQSRAARQEAVTARRQAADSWTAEPMALELASQNDRLNNNRGARELVAGLAMPLWLPGERARTGGLADAEIRASASRVLAAQLRTAANVRASYWQWQRAGIEQALARERLSNTQQLAADVLKRVKVGDLARSDQHQADGAVAGAEAGLAEATGALASASQQLRALLGKVPVAPATPVAEPVPELPADVAALDEHHPALAELLDRAEVARRSTELTRVQTRGNPELTLATSRERGVFNEAYQQSITVGIRIPLGSSDRNQARLATAQADAIEVEGLLRLEWERLLTELDAARIRLESARAQLSAADRRSQLARESQRFFLKSFQMGETDLPTRLRIDLEAIDAERQAARTRIDLAAAISAWRQTLGLLPE
ncbi:TolC family protein [Polaromonas sp. SM01]|uniref:TolC family protein n=1 Tax=Polaromonas sp. SM01 TaxID=3085630 RepID=UPI0029819668|nr:TolC family protein [Polaromonas sp. SM01]MDW5441516.1 TolC family protein [Polaromonas sp. SM01]